MVFSMIFSARLGRFRWQFWGVYHSLAFLILWRRAQPRQFEGAAPEDDTKGELRRRLVGWDGMGSMSEN